MTDLEMEFVLHREVDALLGGAQRGPKQRQRLTKRGWLPEPAWFRVDRDQVGVLPELALGGLVPRSSTVTSRESELLRRLVLQVNRLYKTRAFTTFKAAFETSLREVGSSDVVALLDHLDRTAPDALEGWRVDIQTALEKLEPAGFGIESVIGRVVGVPSRANPDAYLVAVRDLGDPARLSAAAAPIRLFVDSWVALDRVRAWSATRDFLLPIPAARAARAHKEAVMGQLATSSTREDELFDDMFAGLEAAPGDGPGFGPGREHEEEDHAVPAIHAAFSMDMLAGAGTMSRRKL